MGLSAGWGDIYDCTLPDQYIDVTRLIPHWLVGGQSHKDDPWVCGAENWPAGQCEQPRGAGSLPASRAHLTPCELPLWFLARRLFPGAGLRRPFLSTTSGALSRAVSPTSSGSPKSPYAARAGCASLLTRMSGRRLADGQLRTRPGGS
jgi:hypothetical protein